MVTLAIANMAGQRSLYYQRTKIQLAAVDGSSSIKVVVPEYENTAGRRRRPFQY